MQNMSKNLFYSIILLSIFLTSCYKDDDGYQLQNQINIALVDSNATFGTASLFYNLQQIAKNKIIFGHQHSTAYGVFWSGEKSRSDVKDVTGAYPGLIGWDFADMYEGGPVPPKMLKKLVEEAHNNGIISTFTWHMDNFVTGNNFYDTTIVVKHIIPGGKLHNEYVKKLDELASFVKKLAGKDGKVIPIIFRPFHEFDGHWFWWGKRFCTPDEFIQLWKFTVDYLRYRRGVSNILYAYSTDRNFYNEGDFLERFPGDDYVDIIGFDNYWDFSPQGDGLQKITERLALLSQIAKKKNKILAFTETGSETIPDSNWWTDKLLKVIDNDSLQIAYVMVWRNANLTHFYAPYKNHPSSKNFIRFKNHPKIIFSDNIPKLFDIKLKR